MKIAFCSTLLHVPWGGCEVLWVKAAIYMKAEGHDVYAFVKKWNTTPAHYRQLLDAGVKLLFYREEIEDGIFQKIKRNIVPQADNKKELQKIIELRPDYLFFSQAHTYDLAYFSHRGIKSFMAANIPFSVICQNNSEYSWVPAIAILKATEKIFERAHNIFFVSHRNLESAVLHLCRRFDNFSVISNSLSIKATQTEILPMPPMEEIHFACVANLKCSQKAQNLILHVLSSPQWQDRNWKLNFFGTGQDELYLKNLTAFLGLQSRVNFHGHVQDIRKVWQNNHLLLLASFDEGLPLALQEAMLLGRPAVTTDAGGNAELVREGVTGFLSPGTTHSAFSAALERAWSGRERLGDMGIAAYNFASRLINREPEKFLLNVATTMKQHVEA